MYVWTILRGKDPSDSKGKNPYLRKQRTDFVKDPLDWQGLPHASESNGTKVILPPPHLSL